MRIVSPLTFSRIVEKKKCSEFCLLFYCNSKHDSTFTDTKPKSISVLEFIFSIESCIIYLLYPYESSSNEIWKWKKKKVENSWEMPIYWLFKQYQFQCGCIAPFLTHCNTNKERFAKYSAFTRSGIIIMHRIEIEWKQKSKSNCVYHSYERMQWFMVELQFCYHSMEVVDERLSIVCSRPDAIFEWTDASHTDTLDELALFSKFVFWLCEPSILDWWIDASMHAK